MMNIVDTHCHLHFDAFDTDREAVIGRARLAGVRHMINVGTDPENNRKAYELASDHYFMRHTAGLHPHSAHEADEAMLKSIEKFVADTKPAAIGEIGLDYFKSEAPADTQKKIFKRMLGIAKAHKLPVIVHSRNAFDDTYAMLKEEKDVRGVMHCFSYDPESFQKLRGIGFMASFTCNLTFKNASPILDAAVEAPLDSIMLETDSPYLAPQSRRGQRNEPSFLTELVTLLAGKRGVAPEKFAEETTRNAFRFFGIAPADA